MGRPLCLLLGQATVQLAGAWGSPGLLLVLVGRALQPPGLLGQPGRKMQVPGPCLVKREEEKAALGELQARALQPPCLLAGTAAAAWVRSLGRG